MPDLLVLGDTVIDLKNFAVSRSGTKDVLSVREADMLRLLYRNRGQTVPRRRFLREVWGHERMPATRTVDQHMAKLRQKIEADAANPRHILTVFGVGYRLEA